MWKLALLLIFGAPALFLGLRWSWRGVQAGLIKGRVSWAEEVVTGKAATFIGLYCLAWFIALLGVIVWFGVAIFRSE